VLDVGDSTNMEHVKRMQTLNVVTVEESISLHLVDVKYKEKLEKPKR